MIVDRIIQSVIKILSQTQDLFVKTQSSSIAFFKSLRRSCQQCHKYCWDFQGCVTSEKSKLLIFTNVVKVWRGDYCVLDLKPNALKQRGGSHARQSKHIFANAGDPPPWSLSGLGASSLFPLANTWNKRSSVSTKLTLTPEAQGCAWYCALCPTESRLIDVEDSTIPVLDKNRCGREFSVQ